MIILWLIIAFSIGLYLGMLIMACLVMAKRADSRAGIYLPTKGSHATNPFQAEKHRRDGDDN